MPFCCTANDYQGRYAVGVNTANVVELDATSHWTG